MRGFVSQAQRPTRAQDEIIKREQQPTDAGKRSDASAAEKCLAPNYEVSSITGTIANREQALDSIRKYPQQNTIQKIEVHRLGNGAVAIYESTVSDSDPKTGLRKPENWCRTISGSSEKLKMAVASLAGEPGRTAPAGDVATIPNWTSEMKSRATHL